MVWSVCVAYCLVLFFSFSRWLSSEFWKEVPYFLNTTPPFFLRKWRVPWIMVIGEYGPGADSPISYVFRPIWLCVWVFRVRIYCYSYQSLCGLKYILIRVEQVLGKDFPCKLVVREKVTLTQLTEQKRSQTWTVLFIRECMICISEYIYKLFVLLNVALWREAHCCHSVIQRICVLVLSWEHSQFR